MKIGCLTFHNSSNYGAVLQTYALQYAVKKMGYEYLILDYSNQEKKKFDSLLGKNDYLTTKAYLLKLFSLPYNLYKKHKFKRFSARYLNLSSRCKTRKDLLLIGNECDAYLCGSDQIWNLEMIRYDSAYFLDFVNVSKKRIAYAASCGISIISDKQKEFYQKYLPILDYISCREKAGLKIVGHCSQKKAKLVLDPTLLLTKDDWKNICFERVKDEKYILVYQLSKNEQMECFIERIKRQTGLKIIRISRNMFQMFRDCAFYIPSPEGFVDLFMHASYIVTNSFHGTAFSVNFNKCFFSFIRGNEEDRTNSRIAGFLETVGLKKRLYTDCPAVLDMISPCFDQSNRILSELREDSINYLQKSING